MALDEPKEDDEIFKESGLTFMINKQLYEQVKPIQVEYMDTPKGSGYRISANLAQCCGSCSC